METTVQWKGWLPGRRMNELPVGPAPRVRRFWCLWAACACFACEGITGPASTGPVPADLAAPWTTASVAEAGGSPELVKEGVLRAGLSPRMTSLLVAKDGRLVVEEYFGTGHPDTLNDVRSVTKSVVSALAGVALARGDLGSLEDPVAGYLKPVAGRLDEEKRRITVRHLLTMTAGFEWNETDGGGSYREWIESGDHLFHLLDKPLADSPGRRFRYNSAAAHLLGVVLEQATGMRLPDLAEQAVFAPMGVADTRWEAFGPAFSNGGSGLRLRSRDLARLGQLFLQKGVSGQRQILPASWVELSTSAHKSTRVSVGPLRDTQYGFLWWTASPAREPLYVAVGYGGQYVLVAPGLNLVVVATNDWYGAGEDAWFYERETMAVILDYIVPAFR